MSEHKLKQFIKRANRECDDIERNCCVLENKKVFSKEDARQIRVNSQKFIKLKKELAELT